MNILEKLKETVISVFPVVIIVLLLGFTIVPVDKYLLLRFFFGAVLLVIGLTIFLLGVDLGIQPMGERCGAELTKKKNLAILLLAAFVIGFVVTAAEPDIQVFGDQVKAVFPGVNKLIFTLVIAFGVGLFILLGLLRTVLNFSIKWTLFIFYALLFIIVFLAPSDFIGIGFDSGGATTGPMTVPFIMALGLGVARVRSKNNSSFGLTGIASIGPVLAVLIYSLFIKNGAAAGAGVSVAGAETASVAAEASVAAGVEAIAASASDIAAETASVAAGGFFSKVFLPFGQIFGKVVRESLISITPLFIMFIIFQFSLLHMTRRQVVRMIIGFVYSFVGLTIFLTGVNGGFMQAGQALGQSLGTLAVTKGGIWYAILIITGLVFGAIIVCAEPAVWCLSEQVEQVSGGTIKRKFLLLFLSTGTALAIGLAMFRAVKGFDLKWILIPGYIISFVLMIFSPEMFTGIAFDSGGVASGPLTSSFILSFTIGAANAGNNGSDSFGVIALVAMMPLIAIQLMGILFNKKSKVKGDENV